MMPEVNAALMADSQGLVLDLLRLNDLVERIDLLVTSPRNAAAAPKEEPNPVAEESVRLNVTSAGTLIARAKSRLMAINESVMPMPPPGDPAVGTTLAR